MSMLSIQDPSVRTVWPSVFQWVEQPLYNLNEERNKGISESDFKWVVIKQYIYWPLVMCATPVSCLADVVAGLAEAAFSIYQGDSSRVPSILHKKLFASPIQHLGFFSINMLFPVMFGLIATLNEGFKPVFYVDEQNNVTGSAIKYDFSGYKTNILITALILGPLTGFLSYHLAQQAVGKLPNWTHPEGFNIFMNGGCLDPNGRKMTDSDFAEKVYKEYLEKYFDDYISFLDPEIVIKATEHCNAINREMGLPEFNPKPKQKKIAQHGSWEEFIKPFQEKITQINKLPDQLDEFEKFNNAFKNGMSPQECLGITANSKLTLANIKSAYLKWARILHPDKNLDRKEIAEMLIKSLTAARALLEKQL
jgi:hypothetical protein